MDVKIKTIVSEAEKVFDLVETEDNKFFLCKSSNVAKRKKDRESFENIVKKNLNGRYLWQGKLGNDSVLGLEIIEKPEELQKKRRKFLARFRFKVLNTTSVATRTKLAESGFCVMAVSHIHGVDVTDTELITDANLKIFSTFCKLNTSDNVNKKEIVEILQFLDDDREWQESTLESVKSFLSEYNSTNTIQKYNEKEFVFHRGSKFFNKVKTKGSELSGLVSDKWNPADVLVDLTGNGLNVNEYKKGQLGKFNAVFSLEKSNREGGKITIVGASLKKGKKIAQAGKGSLEKFLSRAELNIFDDVSVSKVYHPKTHEEVSDRLIKAINKAKKNKFGVKVRTKNDMLNVRERVTVKHEKHTISFDAHIKATAQTFEKNEEVLKSLNVLTAGLEMLSFVKSLEDKHKCILEKWIMFAMSRSPGLSADHLKLYGKDKFEYVHPADVIEKEAQNMTFGDVQFTLGTAVVNLPFTHTANNKTHRWKLTLRDSQGNKSKLTPEIAPG